MIHIISNPIYFLLICVLLATGQQPNIYSAQDLASATPTGSLTPQTPTGTSGTPSQTYTPSVTPSVTPTTTLMPLPAITLIYPPSTTTSIPTETPKPDSEIQNTKALTNGDILSESPRLRVLSIVLVILWLILAGFLVVYIKQFK